jgi:(2Fe-2S) ferredoxin
MHGSFPTRPVLVCTGKDCTKAGSRLLCALLGDEANVTRVGCQKVCEGPVVGIELDGELRWFERLDSDKARDALLEIVRGEVDGAEELRRSLRKRHVSRRDGTLR